MAKVRPKPANKSRQLRSQQAQALKIKRGNQAIRDLLEEEGLIITTPDVRVFFEENGKLTGGDVISLKTLARMCNLPLGTVLMPRVSIQLKPNGQHP